MADKKISDLTAGSAIGGTEELPIVQSSSTVKTTINAIKTFFDTIFAAIASPTFTGTVTTPAIIVSSETASTIASFDASKNIKSLATATYPSLTELSYVKGVTSSLQTQLDAKLATANNLSDLTNPLTARNNLKQYSLFLTAGDVTTTSATASDVTGLVTTTLTANKRYRVMGIIHVGCTGAGGVKMQVTLPTGATCYLDAIGIVGSSTALGRVFITSSATLTSALCTVNSTAGEFVFNGEVAIGGTAGVVQFGFASGTAGQTSTVYQLGTQLTFTQID